jgi:hypothetical protein
MMYGERERERERGRERHRNTSVFISVVRNKHTHFAVLNKEAHGRIIMRTLVNHQ